MPANSAAYNDMHKTAPSTMQFTEQTGYCKRANQGGGLAQAVWAFSCRYTQLYAMAGMIYVSSVVVAAPRKLLITPKKGNARAISITKAPTIRVQTVNMATSMRLRERNNCQRELVCNRLHLSIIEAHANRRRQGCKEGMGGHAPLVQTLILEEV